MKFKPFPRIYQLGLRYPVFVIILCLLWTGLTLYWAKNLRIEMDFSALLPEQTDSVKNLKELKKNFGSLGYLVLTVDAEIPAKGEAFAEKLAARVEQLPEIRYVDYRPPVEFFEKRQWLFLDIPDLQEMEKRLNRSLELQKLGVSPVFNDLMDFADEADRPDITFEDIRQKYQAKFDPKANESREDTGKEFQILWVKPMKPGNDIDYNRNLVAQVQALETELKQDPGFSSIKVGYTGEYQTSIENIDLTSREIALVSVVVAVLLILILILYFRTISSAFLIGFPLTLGIIWTGGFTYILLGHLNIITAFAATILAGLGSDYGIYLLARFYNERIKGRKFEDACRFSFRNTGKATFASMVTTVGAFLALLFSDFDIFREFGMVGALGLALNYLAMMLLLPSMLALGKRWEQVGWVRRLQDINRIRMPNIQSGWVQRLVSPRGAWAGVLIFILIVGISALSIPKESKIHFEDGTLNTKKLPSNQLDHRVAQMNWNTTNPTVLLTRGGDQEEKTVRGLDQLIQEKDPKERVFKKVFGISSFIPKDVVRKKVILKRIHDKYRDARLINKDRKRQVMESIDESVMASAITLENVPEEIKRKFQSEVNEDVYAIFLFPSIQRSGSENIEKYYRGVQSAKSKAGIDFASVDGAFIQRDVINLIQSEAPKGMILLSVFFGFFVLIMIRPLRNGPVILGSLLGSLVMLSGALYLAGINLNILNIAVIPIIIGTGVDCFFHFNHRFHEEKDLGVVIRNQVPTIFISNLTSIVGFGGLILTSSVGLRSIGWVSVIGLFVVTLVCVLVYPRFLIVMKQSKLPSFSLKDKESLPYRQELSDGMG